MLAILYNVVINDVVYAFVLRPEILFATDAFGIINWRTISKVLRLNI